MFTFTIKLTAIPNIQNNSLTMHNLQVIEIKLNMDLNPIYFEDDIIIYEI